MPVRGMARRRDGGCRADYSSGKQLFDFSTMQWVHKQRQIPTVIALHHAIQMQFKSSGATFKKPSARYF
ncbi:hypothetical protein [Janthinobacterium sp. LM6]|uniref:hypothetical protein n=1 Tax=Janthinobacterium sp. LM6 TaxID=1938606 RepID=UPI00123788ED|nr:hypothetical protein [Janthinobacterium sp. LM6]